MQKFSLTELETVKRWLSNYQNMIEHNRMVIETGDDYAMTNNKWPDVQQLKAEQVVVKNQQRFANELFLSAKKLEKKLDENTGG